MRESERSVVFVYVDEKAGFEIVDAVKKKKRSIIDEAISAFHADAHETLYFALDYSDEKKRNEMYAFLHEQIFRNKNIPNLTKGRIIISNHRHIDELSKKRLLIDKFIEYLAIFKVKKIRLKVLSDPHVTSEIMDRISSAGDAIAFMYYNRCESIHSFA